MPNPRGPHDRTRLAFVMSKLEQVLVRIEDVEALSNALCAQLLAVPLHIADRVESVAVGDAGLLYAVQNGIILALGSCEGDVLAALCTPGRKLDRKVRRNPDDREWIALATIREAEHIDVEGEALLHVIDVEDDMVGPDGHVPSCAPR